MKVDEQVDQKQVQVQILITSFYDICHREYSERKFIFHFDLDKLIFISGCGTELSTWSTLIRFDRLQFEDPELK